MNRFLLSKFSLHVPVQMQKTLHAVSNHFQVDESLAMSVLLGMCSSLVHDKFKVRVHDQATGAHFDESLSLFCIGIASSSERKSPLFKWFKNPLLEAIEEINTERKKATLKQECERKVATDEMKKLRKKTSSLPPDSPLRAKNIERLMELEAFLQQLDIEPLRVFLQDTTAAASANFMKTQPGNALMIADAEGGSLDSVLADHRLQELLLSGFSNEGISFERASRPSVEIQSPHASMCILTQEAKLHKLAKKPETWDEGLIPRSLILFANEKAGMRSTPIGTAIPEEYSVWWKEKCQFFLNCSYPQKNHGDRDYHYLELSPEAATVWYNFSFLLEEKMKEPDTYPLRAWLGKMGGVATRIASIYHLFELTENDTSKISWQHMQMACNLVLEFLPHMQEVHKIYFPQNDVIEKAVHKIVRWLKHEYYTIAFFKLREVYRATGIPADVARFACDKLCCLGVLNIQTIQEHKLGRHATPVFTVNNYSLKQLFPDSMF